MRKVTRDAVAAFLADRVGSFGGNTTVERSPLGAVTVLKLHGNAIARKDVGSPAQFEVCDGGWSSRTTKERLNGLPHVSVMQRNWVWHLNGAEWNGSWALVKRGV